MQFTVVLPNLNYTGTQSGGQDGGQNGTQGGTQEIWLKGLFKSSETTRMSSTSDKNRAVAKTLSICPEGARCEKTQAKPENCIGSSADSNRIQRNLENPQQGSVFLFWQKSWSGIAGEESFKDCTLFV